MDELSVISVLKISEWNTKKKQLMELAKEHYKTCQNKKANFYSRWERALKQLSQANN
jgi:hypothetical protein